MSALIIALEWIGWSLLGACITLCGIGVYVYVIYQTITEFSFLRLFLLPLSFALGGIIIGLGLFILNPALAAIMERSGKK